MKSLTTLQLTLLTEIGEQCGVDTSRDVKYITERIENQGDSFLTITLPKFAKDLERALDMFQVTPDLFVGYRRSKGSSIPTFLGGFLGLIFDTYTGKLDFYVEEDRAIDIIRGIRQFCGFSAKIERPCSPERVAAAFDKYVEIENKLHAFEFSTSDLLDFERMSSALFGQMFSDMDDFIRTGKLTPKHGPGAVADKLPSNQRWDHSQLSSTWHSRLEESFPIGENLFTSWRHFLAALDDNELVAWPGAEMPVKVIQVPKTMSTPRIIAEEPAAVMYMQQALQLMFLDFFPRYKAGRLVDYSSQEPNRRLAKLGSIDRSLATLDLSEASDRVDNRLVNALFRNHPRLLAAMDAVRTRQADVQGRGVIPLAKYASMGSAVCFPVEAMVFLTLTFLGIQRDTGLPCGVLLADYGRGTLVRVYGDDIIAPVHHVHAIVNTLEAFGLKVNYSKSFSEGYFRESCGADWYAGVDVTICRIRHDLPSRSQSQSEFVESVTATVSLRNEFYTRGYWKTVKVMDEWLEKDLNGHFPAIHDGSVILGRLSFLPLQNRLERWSNTLHVTLTKGYKRKDPIPSDKIDGIAALNKVLRNTSGLPNPDPSHLSRGGRPQVRHIKLGWFRAY